MRAFRRAFLAASIAWAAALPLASWTASRPHPAAPAVGLAFLVYATGSFICHQLPERSFQLWGAQMPVCARCTGLYAGAGAAALLIAGRVRAAGLARRLQPRARAVLVVAAVPTAATVGFEWATGITPSNPIRAMAGVALGAALAWAIAGAARVSEERKLGKVN